MENFMYKEFQIRVVSRKSSSGGWVPEIDVIQYNKGGSQMDMPLRSHTKAFQTEREADAYGLAMGIMWVDSQK